MLMMGWIFMFLALIVLILCYYSDNQINWTGAYDEDLSDDWF